MVQVEEELDEVQEMGKTETEIAKEVLVQDLNKRLNNFNKEIKLYNSQLSQIEEDNNKTSADIQSTMASVLLGIHEKINKQTRSNQSDVTLPMDLTVQPVNGEMFVGVDDINIAEFRSQ